MLSILQDDFDSIRPLCYPGSDVFLLCFSVVSPTSFHNVSDKWLAEIKDHCKNIPIILVGTQCDLRNDVKVLIDLAQYEEKPITEAQAQSKANQIKALCYLECSALTQKNLKEVFDMALLAALEQKGALAKYQKGRHSKKNKDNEASSSDDQYSSLAGNRPQIGSPRCKETTTWKKLCCFV